MGNDDAADNDTNKNSQVAVDEKDVPKEDDGEKTSSDKEEKPAADEDKKQDKEDESKDTKKENAQSLGVHYTYHERHALSVLRHVLSSE